MRRSTSPPDESSRHRTKPPAGGRWKPRERKLSNQPKRRRALDRTCRCGIAHNGIIRLTTDPTNTQYSDTAIFITDYLAEMVRKSSDLRNQTLLDRIYYMARSKFAIMDAGGWITTIGEFIDDHGLLFSNDSYEMYRCS